MVIKKILVLLSKYLLILQADLQNHKEIQGILEYMDNSLSVLGNLEKRMAKIGSGELS